MLFVLFFLLGLAVGSFLNCLIHRLETRESIITKRSYCPHCKKTLSWFELIPIVSFILQKGRCRHCGKPVLAQYPLVELITGVLFVLIFNFQFSIFIFFVVSCLIVIFVYDLRHYIIPDEVIYPAIVLSLGFRIWNLFGIWDLVLGILPTLLFLAIVLFSKGRWMGAGDIKLVLFMGLVLGWPNILVALFLAFLVGAFVSVILIIFRKKTLKSQVPFGPFLAGSTVVALFWGNFLISWYLSLFVL